LLSDEARAMIERARATSWAEEDAARRGIGEIESAVNPHIAGHDGLLDLCTAVPALPGLATTGPSDFIKTWMCFGLPQVALPALTSAEGLPLGLQLVSGRYRDAELLMVARTVASALGCERLRRARI
jgi:Asp-tRNA(Asn)/Glu-tRNA(Gln) amidotransferase A subunit family amidase